MWKCPKCQSQALNVMITTCAKLTQDEYCDNFETEVISDHEWDGTSNMTCEDCGFCDAAATFETEEDEEEPQS